MDMEHALKFSYSSVTQEIICETDAISGIGHTLDRLGARTAMAHHVGALYNVPHGEANAILLPHSMRFNLDASAERQALIASATLHDRALATNPKPISDAGPIIGVLRNAW